MRNTIILFLFGSASTEAPVDYMEALRSTSDYSLDGIGYKQNNIPHTDST